MSPSKSPDEKDTETVATAAEQAPDDKQELREEIEETREELGDTVEALAQKADVKAQVKEKVDERKEQAQAKLGEVGQQAKDRQTPIAAVAKGLVALLLLRLVLKRRK